VGRSPWTAFSRLSPAASGLSAGLGAPLGDPRGDLGAGSLFPVLGSVWLTLSSVIAFVAAAWNAGASDRPARQGALNALCGYLLVLPLVLMASYQPSVVQITATAVVAVFVGALAGWIRGHSEPHR
jgi:hypothetical protein